MKRKKTNHWKENFNIWGSKLKHLKYLKTLKVVFVMIYHGGLMINPDTILKVAPFLLRHSIPYALYTIDFELYF